MEEEDSTSTPFGKEMSSLSHSPMVNTHGKDMVIDFLPWTHFLQATSHYVENTLKPKGMPTADYLALTKEALTKQDTEKKRFSYNLQQGTNLLLKFH